MIIVDNVARLIGIPVLDSVVIGVFLSKTPLAALPAVTAEVWQRRAQVGEQLKNLAVVSTNMPKHGGKGGQVGEVAKGEYTYKKLSCDADLRVLVPHPRTRVV